MGPSPRVLYETVGHTDVRVEFTSVDENQKSDKCFRLKKFPFPTFSISYEETRGFRREVFLFLLFSNERGL